MPKKKETQASKAEAFQSALAGLAEAKGITVEAVLDALHDALERAYIKYLDQGDDVRVKVDIDQSTGTIVLAQIKTVVEEVEDDALEISYEDANEGLKKAKFNIGDDFEFPCPVEELSKLTAMAVKSILRQKIAEAERSALYEIYKDHIGEMVTGVVEKADDRSVTVNIGRTTVELTRREMIGDEYYKVGDQIKVYIQEVKSARPVEEGEKAPKKRGPQIEVTRSSEGFLKRLFEEEIHEVYDGTVIIKAIAREAGVRSKVAVTSNNEDIDATGACIGPAGTRIQKIVAQLGNGKDKEKIDVINYSTNPACFIIEALRPATVIGVNLTDPDAEPNPKATAIIKDGQKSIAIGRKAANARLASKITGWSIDIKEESEAAELGLEYKSSEEWIRESDLEKRALEKEAFLAKTRAAKAEAEEKKQEEIVLEPTLKPAPKAAVSEEDFPEEAINPAAAALAEAQRQDALRAEEEAKEAARKAEEEEKAKAPVEPTFVRTTTTLSSLEAELESAKEKKSKPVSKKRPRKITEDEVKNVATPSAENAPQPAVNAMPIYTKEEMDEIAKEEEEANDNSFYDDDIDYEEYDQYYDDDEGGRR